MYATSILHISRNLIDRSSSPCPIIVHARMNALYCQNKGCGAWTRGAARPCPLTTDAHVSMDRETSNGYQSTMQWAGGLGAAWPHRPGARRIRPGGVRKCVHVAAGGQNAVGSWGDGR